MKRRPSDTEQTGDDYATAMAKVRLWESRAIKARQTGRKADADRCEDKVREWASGAKQADQLRSSEIKLQPSDGERS